MSEEFAIAGSPISGSDSGLLAALTGAALPTDDLHEPGRRFFAYETLARERVGYGGLELYGRDLLLRSIVVPVAARKRGFGTGIVALLLRSGYDLGARQAWLLTTSAGGFFSKAGFEAADRSLAPATILSTRQASTLCPASALLLTRAIHL